MTSAFRTATGPGSPAGALLRAASLLLLVAPARALDRSQTGYFCVEAAEPFFSSSGGKVSTSRSGALPQSFTTPKPPGARRVFIVGGTPAFRLGSAAAGGRTEVVNCGMQGYDSSRVRRVAEEALGYEPDLLIVLAGSDEGEEEPCSGAEADLRREQFRALERSFFTAGRGRREAASAASLALYRRNLDAIAGAAKKAGIPVVFATLPVALRDLPPDAPLPLGLRAFAEGYTLFHSGLYREASARFDLALSAGRPDPAVCFYAARSREKLGETEAAGKLFARAAALDPDSARPSIPRNGAVRAAAAAGGGCLADLEAFFASRAAGGLTGFDEMLDGVRWRAGLNGEVAAELLRAAGRCGLKGLGPWPGAEPAGAAGKDAGLRFGYALSRLGRGALDERALAELARLRTEAPGLLADAALLPATLAGYLPRGYPHLGEDRDAARLLPDLLAHLAEAERRAGDLARARRLCERALSLDPAAGYMHLEHAVILADMGLSAEAGREFLAVSEDSAARGRAPR